MYGVQVRGATDPHAEAYAVLFGDFLGLSMTLQRLNGDITGTYMSCSPLDEHFAILGKQTPPTHDMKFGQNPDGRPLYTYSSTKHQKDHLSLYKKDKPCVPDKRHHPPKTMIKFTILLLGNID